MTWPAPNPGKDGKVASARDRAAMLFDLFESAFALAAESADRPDGRMRDPVAP